MPNQQHHLISTQTQTLSPIQLRTQRLILQSPFLYPDKPWHGENCFDETSESSTKNLHAYYDTSSSCHHHNLSYFLFENQIHASLTHSFWKIFDAFLRNLYANALTCNQFP